MVVGNKYHTIPYHIIPYLTIPHRIIPYHTSPYHTTPYHTTPHHTIPHHIIYHTIPHHTIPHHTIPHHIIPYHIIVYHTTPHHTISCHTTPYHTLQQHLISMQKAPIMIKVCIIRLIQQDSHLHKSFYLLQAEHRQVKKYCFCSRLCRTSLVMRLALGPKIHLNNSIMSATSIIALHVGWSLSDLYASQPCL